MVSRMAGGTDARCARAAGAGTRLTPRSRIQTRRMDWIFTLGLPSALARLETETPAPA
jgi:hypothetical protein